MAENIALALKSRISDWIKLNTQLEAAKAFTVAWAKDHFVAADEGASLTSEKERLYRKESEIRKQVGPDLTSAESPKFSTTIDGYVVEILRKEKDQGLDFEAGWKEVFAKLREEKMLPRAKIDALEAMLPAKAKQVNYEFASIKVK